MRKRIQFFINAKKNKVQKVGQPLNGSKKIETTKDKKLILILIASLTVLTV